METWSKQLETALKQFENIDIGYPKGINQVYFHDTGFSLKTKLSLPESLLEFYSGIKEINLSDIYTGYFLISLTQLENRSLQGQVPTKIQRSDHLERIVSFGSTGGGDIFATPEEGGEPIYLLPSFGATGSIYHTDINPVYVVATNLQDFLNMLALDVQAFVEGKENWRYLTDVINDKM